MVPGVQAVPVLAWAHGARLAQSKDALANNPRLRRQRQVAQIIREGLNDLRPLGGGKQQ